jgi:TRAP-type uncharacterized transport system substrate-binding protein
MAVASADSEVPAVRVLQALAADNTSAMNILKRLLQNRLRPLMAPFGVVALIVLAAWVVLAFLRPMPHRSVVMAIYPEGTLNADLVKRYREVLAHDGIELKLEPSAGAVESLARLRDPRSATSIALIPGGITTEQESPGLVSLGTVFYQPLWIFSRGHLLQRHGKLRRLRISIGPEGSSSRALSLKLLGRAGIIDPQSATLLPFTPAESAEKLIHGEIDVAVFLDAWESSAVQQLVNAKDVNLASIHRADAFVALYPFLNKLVLPAGLVDMARPRPPEDVLLIATKSSLLVRNDLNPAIQYAVA